MQFLDTVQQTKTQAELCVQRLHVVTDDFKSAAFGRAFRAKGAYEHVAARLHRANHLANVRDTLRTWVDTLWTRKDQRIEELRKAN